MVVLAAIVAALVVPVGFALSLSSGSNRATVAVRTGVPAESVAVTSAVLLASDSADRASLNDLPDPVKLFLVGTMLVAIAIAVRKAA